jgi:hypothetical protein
MPTPPTPTPPTDPTPDRRPDNPPLPPEYIEVVRQLEIEAARLRLMFAERENDKPN